MAWRPAKPATTSACITIQIAPTVVGSERPAARNAIESAAHSTLTAITASAAVDDTCGRAATSQTAAENSSRNAPIPRSSAGESPSRSSSGPAATR